MFTRYLIDLINLIFPLCCETCGNKLYKNEKILCTKCMIDLPLTNYVDFQDNKVCRLFWGRTKIENATSYFYYFKESKYHQLIHEFKYKGKKHIGYEFGILFGHSLLNSAFEKIDLIIPVPLHYKKQKRRGYNQSHLIAEGLGKILNKPVRDGLIKRIIDTQTQTKRTRYDRWQNVEGIFKVIHPTELEQKHVLVVDDIVTTGSTLEACANELLKLNNTRVSIATLAFAEI